MLVLFNALQIAELIGIVFIYSRLCLQALHTNTSRFWAFRPVTAEESKWIAEPVFWMPIGAAYLAVAYVLLVNLPLLRREGSILRQVIFWLGFGLSSLLLLGMVMSGG